MQTLAARRGTFLLVVILLLVSILLEQAVAGYIPWLGQLGGVRPSIVFLDIPLEAPVTIDWLPVGFIFILFYTLVDGGRGEPKPRGEVRGRGWAILRRWWLLLILLLMGGGLFYLVSDYLPKAIRNGLDSFGMRADLVLPYPSGEIVHLHGSMMLLVCFIIGWRLLIKSATPARPVEGPVAAAGSQAMGMAEMARNAAVRQEAGKVEVPQRIAARQDAGKVEVPRVMAPLPSPAAAGAPLPGRGRMVMQIPEPVEWKTGGRDSHVYVALPPGFKRGQSSYPCVVGGAIRPTPPKISDFMMPLLPGKALSEAGAAGLSEAGVPG